MSRVRARKAALLLVSALLAMALAGCSGAKRISVSASFADIGDLANHAPVMMNDVRIGEVTSMKLVGYRALVTMSIDPAAKAPQGVIARVRRTSLLGERIVDLEIPAGLPASAPSLADGATIEQTLTRSDLEDLVRSGNSVLAPITASEVATLVNEGAKGFGNSGQDLATVLNNLQGIVHAYAGRTDEIESVITSINQLNVTLATHLDAHSLALRNTNRALDVLREESGRLQTAIHELARLSVGARSILTAHVDEMGRFFGQMRTILTVLKSEEKDLEGFLKYAPIHNRNTQLVEFETFNQIFQDFVICGLNDDPSDKARQCKGGP